MRRFTPDWRFIICLLSFFIGFISSFYFSPPKLQHLIVFSTNNHFNHGLSFNLIIFFKIFSRNAFVSFLLSIISFVGFGILSPLILLLNGVYLGELVNFRDVSFNKIYGFLIFHGPIEIISFSFFGSIGLRGIKFYIEYFRSGWKIAREYIPGFREFILPTFLLIIAALIESLLIVNY